MSLLMGAAASCTVARSSHFVQKQPLTVNHWQIRAHVDAVNREASPRYTVSISAHPTETAAEPPQFLFIKALYGPEYSHRLKLGKTVVFPATNDQPGRILTRNFIAIPASIEKLLLVFKVKGNKNYLHITMAKHPGIYLKRLASKH